MNDVTQFLSLIKLRGLYAMKEGYRFLQRRHPHKMTARNWAAMILSNMVSGYTVA